MAKLPWKPWHEVVALREDLKSGDLPLHLFAADLYEVMMQNGKRPVYENPTEFFGLTYPTHNLRNLVREVVLRLAGKNDKAVRQLELTYGGGKTHTLITMRHLVHDPASLPALPAVEEFKTAVGHALPKCRVAAVCFDKLDVETGCEVRAPNGKVRRLKQPWSVIAYQLAGDEGLKLMHAEGKAEERATPPAEGTLTDLFSLPAKEDMGTLILLDEVLLYAKVKCHADPGWIDVLTVFFQYLTQAAAKADRCCVVASLLSSEPADQADEVGKKIVAKIYDIFQRQREAAVQPVEKDDVAEVLRRRLFDVESLRDRDSWRQHVIAAFKGIAAVDDRTAKEGAEAEARYEKSFPFDPQLTDTFYTKWSSGIERFQKTRGVLRTFALALRAAVKWDTSPLVGPAVFLSPPEQAGLSESARELVSIADTVVTDGQSVRWAGILEDELARARDVQAESVGLRQREIEQAVFATFLHSQPAGRSAKTRDLVLLVGACRPDKIELEKGLNSWARRSHWLDDADIPDGDSKLPESWRLGNRPNLTQMQSTKAKNIQEEVIRARLRDEVERVRSLTQGAAALGVKVHMLPRSPRDVEDDGQMHFAVLAPSAASESGKPSAEAVRFLRETSGPDKPRTYKNAVMVLTPSRDGLNAAEVAVRNFLAWEQVQADLAGKPGEGKPTVDPIRMANLKTQLDKARDRVPEAIRQAWCVVVTVSDKGEDQAFKITVGPEPHFDTIRAHKSSRIQERAVTAEALLPDGPYNLWRAGETSRRVRELADAFAQFPHLPKMLKPRAILDTLIDGCVHGTFVLRLARPDGTAKTWWRNRPDEAALEDTALEVVLPEAAELSDVAPQLLEPTGLPELWAGNEITVGQVAAYFDGTKVVQVDRSGFKEPQRVPKASAAVVETATSAAVQAGRLWMLSGPASLLAEEVPTGVATPAAKLRLPPAPLPATAILAELLPSAWSDGATNGLAIMTALSQQHGVTMPWKTVREAIEGAVRARFLKLADDSGPWPCDLTGAKSVKLESMGAGGPGSGGSGGASGGDGRAATPRGHVLAGELEPNQLQDLVDLMPAILKAGAESGLPIGFRVELKVGEPGTAVPEAVAAKLKSILGALGDTLRPE
jgi:hypothetical protein